MQMSKGSHSVYHNGVVGKRQKAYRYMSLNLWGNVPSKLQKAVSKIYANVYNRKWTKHIIKPYCRYHYKDPNYIDQFKPADINKERFESFQDFFTREFIEPPKINTEHAWACEGLLCQYGKVGELPLINIKGDRRNIKTIFGNTDEAIPADYYFSNIFLHNNNYHRIHAPVKGKVTRIERINGDLVLLRPWAYKQPSTPALRNERVNIDITDKQGRKWYLSIVGGPGVGSILVINGIEVGTEVNVGEEISLFLLGSTCCIACPESNEVSKIGDIVYMGDPL
jgi:phosphatidylserine decarboxylase